MSSFGNIFIPGDFAVVVDSIEGLQACRLALEVGVFTRLYLEAFPTISAFGRQLLDLTSSPTAISATSAFYKCLEGTVLGGLSYPDSE